jgi:hypothetical protein
MKRARAKLAVLWWCPDRGVLVSSCRAAWSFAKWSRQDDIYVSGGRQGTNSTAQWLSDRGEPVISSVTGRQLGCLPNMI